MSTKMEARQCTPSVIARLMGLDELSRHQPVQKKQNVLSENYLRRVASIGLRGKHSSHERHSFRLSDAEQKEYTDAFDIHEKTKREDCNLLAGKGKSELSLSTVEEVRNAEAVPDSKIDLFMKYLLEPEPFIAKHPRDWQGTPHHLQSGFLTVLKSSNASDAGNTDLCSIFGRETYQESAKLLWKLETGLKTDSRGEHVIGNGYKFLRSQKELVNLPTKVFILTTKLGKKESGNICFPSSNFYSDSHSIDRKHNEFLSSKRGNLCVEEEKRNYVAKDVEPLRSRVRISREISRKTGPRKNNVFAKVSKAGSRDNYSFAEGSELKSFSFPSSGDWKNHSDESYVAREARKEILERRTTKKFQEVEVASRNRTLDEMLAIPDQESSPHNSDFKAHEHGQSSQTGLHSNLFMRAPEKRLQQRFRKQRHNQKDGSEYRNSGSSCMESHSIPCLELSNSHSVQDDCVLHGEQRRKLEEKDTCEQAYMVFKLSTSCCSCPYSSTQEGRGVLEEQQQEKKLEEKDLSERSTVVAKSSVSVAAARMVADMATDAETGVEGQSSENHQEHIIKMTNCMLLEDGFSSQVLDATTPQDMPIGIFKEDSVSSFGSCIDTDSLVKKEEADQRSPNSVLEPLFEKGISSSFGCCRVVHSNLHGLQLQLELLKSKSWEAYSEGDGMIVSSDDDLEEGSVSHSGENEEVMRVFSVEESRDFSYLIDVFTEAGFHGRNSGLSYKKRHSPERPISPTVFETLEKTYGEQMSWKRSERRLLFDCINSELMEILKPSIGVHGTIPLSKRLLFGKNPEMIEEELWMLLVHQQKQASTDASTKVLGKDDKWLELGDDIEIIVREIENSLIDLLAEEVVSMESF